MNPAVGGILETALYVDDVARSAEFYTALFGFPTLIASDRIVALDVAGRDVLLLFKRGATTQPIPLEDGFIPPHDAGGNIHLAFSVALESLPDWEARLAGRGVAVESRHRWPRGGTSVYFRDPDGHLVELVTPGCWATY
ncbi:MAG TPA: VOC family protein [Candidatus Krumholzibacteria bacterium]|nr:VOC family protein [Candidatus Krumholzibacteria bacterium]